MPALIRIKTQDLLSNPELLAEAKALCSKVTFERDEVAFEPRAGYLVPLVVLLSQANVSYSTSFSKDENAEMRVVKEV